MGLLESVLSTVEKHEQVNPQQHESLVQGATEMFGNYGSLLQLFHHGESQGLGGLLQSWIGNGANQPIDPGQLQNLVGPDKITELANRAGVSRGVAQAALSRILPVLVDKLTPNGQLPRAA